MVLLLLLLLLAVVIVIVLVLVFVIVVWFKLAFTPFKVFFVWIGVVSWQL